MTSSFEKVCGEQCSLLSLSRQANRDGLSPGEDWPHGCNVEALAED